MRGNKSFWNHIKHFSVCIYMSFLQAFGEHIGDGTKLLKSMKEDLHGEVNGGSSAANGAFRKAGCISQDK